MMRMNCDEFLIFVLFALVNTRITCYNEVRSQKSEVRSQKSEVRSQKQHAL
jgi:predicted Holliday junction resolvase-like endonuclease